MKRKLTVIPLVGVSNSGKTSTIRELMLRILESEQTELLYSSKYKNVDIETFKQKIKDDRETNSGAISDISIVVRYKGKTIFITSNGDSISDIQNVLRNCFKKFNDIDFVICARHDCNDVEQEFHEFGEIKSNPIAKQKKDKDHFDDSEKAQEIMDRLDYYSNIQ